MYKHFPPELWSEVVSEVERISPMVSGMALRGQHLAAAMSYFALSRHLFLVCIFNFLKIIITRELPVSQSQHRCKGPRHHVRSQGHIKAGWLLSKASFSYVSAFEQPNCLFLLNGLSHGLEWI